MNIQSIEQVKDTDVKYKVSVSVLEKFRRFQTGTTEYDTEQALLDTIMGKFVPNDKVKFGSAIHKIIERFNREAYNGEMYVDDFILSSEQYRPALEYRKQHPLMIHEVPISKVYQTRDLQLLVTGRADGIEGVEIRDIKAKFSLPLWSEYYVSYQWRFYLSMFGLDTFWYDIFEVRDFPPAIINGRAIGAYVLEPESFQCLRYDALEDDVLTLCNDFAEFMIRKNYLNLLTKIK